MSQRCSGIAETSSLAVIQPIRSKRFRFTGRECGAAFSLSAGCNSARNRTWRAPAASGGPAPGSAPGVVRFGDRAPVPSHAENGEDVVVVAPGFEIEEQQRMPEHSRCCGPQQRAFHAMRVAAAQHSPRRPARWTAGLLVLREIVEEARNLGRRGQAAEHGGFRGVEGGHGCIAGWIARTIRSRSSSCMGRGRT